VVQSNEWTTEGKKKRKKKKSYTDNDYKEAVDKDHLSRIFGRKNMLCDRSRQKRVIPALLREEVWISSRREDLELDIIGKGACAPHSLVMRLAGGSS
jgi:hypothetical protein